MLKLLLTSCIVTIATFYDTFLSQASDEQIKEDLAESRLEKKQKKKQEKPLRMDCVFPDDSQEIIRLLRVSY